ncbi:helix-turn-helix domain-containing protein [Streptococcus suis]
MAVGINIKNIRLSKKITQKNLSDKTKINQSIISRYEYGTIVPPIPKLEIIAQALEVDIKDLLDSA